MKARKLFLGAALGLLSCVGCTDYQDEIDALDGRVTVLEELVNRVNNEIVSLRALVDAMETGDVITSVEELKDAGGNVTGYKLHFLNHDPLELRHGLDGRDGTDAATPLFAVATDTEGNYCWQVSYDGGKTYDWVTDEQGRLVKAVGADGKDGESTTPQLRVDNEGLWQVSYDNGDTWEVVTNPITNTPMSAKGADGKDAVTTFKEVVKVYAPDGVTVTGWRFTLQSGESFTIDQFVTAQSVTIRLDGAPVTAPVVVAKNETVRLSAEVYPENTRYDDILWYVSEGNASHFVIATPYARETAVSAKETGQTAKIRAVARFSEPGGEVVYAEVTMVCN